MKNYIPVELWRTTYTRPQIAESFTFVEKVPLSKIKIDKSFFAYQNDVSCSRVDFIIKNFDIDFWMPILINPNYFLLDGQHRLQVAKKLGLKYIDVVIEKDKKL